MKEEHQQQLITKYPKIFKELRVVECGDGWYTMLCVLCECIQLHIDNTGLAFGKEGGIPQVEAHQVKEKFGGLRFYYGGGDKHIEGLVSFAEALSYTLCDVCGGPARSRNSPGGWIFTRCEGHKPGFTEKKHCK
jgi:hypothetical protein